MFILISFTGVTGGFVRWLYLPDSLAGNCQDCTSSRAKHCKFSWMLRSNPKDSTQNFNHRNLGKLPFVISNVSDFVRSIARLSLWNPTKPVKQNWRPIFETWPCRTFISQMLHAGNIDLPGDSKTVTFLSQNGGHEQPLKGVTFSPSQKRAPVDLTGT